MRIFIWVFSTFCLFQCRSNDVIDVTHIKFQNVHDISRDTTIKIQSIYRGDTMYTFVRMKGDTIVERITTKYASTKEGEDGYMSTSRMHKTLPSKPRREMMDASAISMEAVSSSVGRDRIKPSTPTNPQAGQITAGEWNDLSNWDDWSSLLNDNDYNQMQEMWAIYPSERYSVFVSNKDNIPLVDLKVELLSGDKILWSSRTDNAGKAELWAGIFKDQTIAKSSLNVKVYHNGISYGMEVTNDPNLSLTINSNCTPSKNVDIMFVVDATGSMGDEINYLKSEIKDVIERSIKNQGDLNLRIGSVFYRDMNDQYLTKVSPLSNNHERIYDFINEQSANGGGDYPEAVDAALEEGLSQKWSDNAITRIIFLLLDAPPHDEPEIKSSIRDQIAEAAERGIKIIPVSASGINRETEFLLKFMSIATNGTYVFITDDSGIGNPHLDPLVDDYDVERLNDLLVRLISNYTKQNGCNENKTVNKKVKIFPNPTSNFLNVESEFDFEELRVVSNSGKVVVREKNFSDRAKLDLSFLVDGIYTLQCLGVDYQYSQPVIVVRG